MKIALDAMGSDARPAPDVAGAVLAAREFGVTILLVGDENKIKAELGKHATQGLDLHVVHAPTEIGMTEHVEAVKAKKDASMNIAVKLVRQKEADAFVTMGNSGAAMAAALLGLGRIKGIERPAFAAIVPSENTQTLCLDIGANAEVKPEYLYQFALMGSIYMEKVIGVPNPRVALLSNGEEEGKGTMAVREAYTLLKQSKLNFIGNAEGRHVLRGYADVVVSDGFAGNVMIKTMEGTAEVLVDFIKSEIKRRPLAVLGGLLAKPAFDALKRRLDYAEIGGAPVLGVDGVTIIGHGRSNAKAVKNAIRAARLAVAQNMLDAIRAGLEFK
ncbi:MAG: phosphate acyltransferase PlsX [Chloroflexi bacterium]|nr:phosphate acyltransferase PlsX [Chloroflexota bacterium]